jgi:NAD(P)-dependent dehydrogenase (short-subunit alcohol dehydrogenase family)
MNRYEPVPGRPVAIVTGASAGLGLALTRLLVDTGWHVVVDARHADRLADAVRRLPADGVTAVAGDVRDAAHRAVLVETAERLGGIHLLVNNASMLGGSPQPPLADLAADVLAEVLAVNTVAPHDLVRRALPALSRARGCVVNVSSDAAVEAYEGWGAYAAAKAALDQLSAVLAVEHRELAVYAVDPGDMNTDLHQQAFPGEDITDLPAPEAVAPAVLQLVTDRPPSGRYRAADLLVAGDAAVPTEVAR